MIFLSPEPVLFPGPRRSTGTERGMRAGLRMAHRRSQGRWREMPNPIRRDTTVAM